MSSGLLGVLFQLYGCVENPWCPLMLEKTPAFMLNATKRT